MPQTIDPNAVFGGALSQAPGFAASGYNLASLYNPQYTGLNLANFQQLSRGQFDPGAFDAANPGFLQSFREQQAQGQLQGWTPEQFAYAYAGKQYNDPSLKNYYSGGIGQMVRQNYDAANPDLAAYTQGLGAVVNGLNSQAPAGYGASLMGSVGAGPAATAGYTGAGYTGAGYTGAGYTGAGYTGARGIAASGGPLMGSLNRSAAYNLDRASPIQSRLQGQAMELLGANGGLTAGELANVQDSVRSAYADRGLLRSNSGVGAEILQTDQARRQRMLENTQYAQGIDASGQQQLQANRNYALGVQGQGQNLSQFNSGLLTSTNTFNAGQANQIGMYNAGQANQIGMYNAGQANQIGMYNAGQANQIGMFNAGQANQLGTYNAGQANLMAQYNAGLLQQSGLYNAGALNDAARFNTTLQAQNLNDAWGRYMGYGNFQASQAQNPNALAMGLMGQVPDYTGQLLNTTSQIQDYNANAVNAAAIAKGNNNAATTGAAIGGVATLGAGIAIAF